MQNPFIGRPITTQTITIGAASAAITNAVNAYVNKVRIATTGNCHIKIDNTPVATSSDLYLPAGAVEYFTLSPGQKVAAIQDGAATGTVYVTEMSQ